MMINSPIKNHFRDYSLEISVDHKREPETRFLGGITFYFPYYVAEWKIKDMKYACSIRPIIALSKVTRPEEDLERMFQYLSNAVKESERDYTLQTKGKELKLIPLEDISKLLAFAMREAVSHGANSVSMPAEIVSVAHFLSYPDEYIYKP